MKLNKIRNILLINILIFVILFILLNIFIENEFVKGNNNLINEIRNDYRIKFSTNYNNTPIDITMYETEEDDHNLIVQNEDTYNQFCSQDHLLNGFENNYTKNPIIVLGCSYAYGHGLKKDQTFPYLLSKLTERPVFNFAKCGSEILESLNYLFSYEGGDNNIEKLKNTEYIIYIYMYDHINRFLDLYGFNNKIIYTFYYQIFRPNGIESIIAKFPLGRYILSVIRLKIMLKNFPFVNKDSSLLIKNIIIYAKEKLIELYPNAKMIIILYDEKIPVNTEGIDKIKFCSDKMNDSIWDELQKEEDITVVHTKDLTGFLFDKDYKLEYDIAGWHPNEKAWEVLTPLFAEKYIK